MLSTNITNKYNVANCDHDCYFNWLIILVAYSKLALFGDQCSYNEISCQPQYLLPNM